MAKGINARKVTEVIVADIARHGDSVVDSFESMLENGELSYRDIDLRVALEHDFGRTNTQHRLENASRDAMEQIITSGIFNKMVAPVFRASLREQPKEEYMLLNILNGSAETKGECEDGFKDFGVFSDPKVAELCDELDKPPSFGLASDYMTHPTGQMVGLSLHWTRQAVCRDPNGFLLQQVPKIADAHNAWIEDRLIDLLIGYKKTYNMSGTSYDTYYGPDNEVTTPFEDGSNGPWINAGANDIICPEDLDAIRDMFFEFRDMVHGRPVNVSDAGLSVMTSKKHAAYILKKMAAQQIEEDVTCNSGSTVKYVMSGDVANSMTFGSVTGYHRLVDAIVSRYEVTKAEAEKWFWLGNLPEFMRWVYNRRPAVTRCPLGAEECQREIVALYTSRSKGYGYILNPMRGMLFVPTETGSES